MGLRFDRHLGPATSLDVKQWTDCTASGKPAVRCPSCGEVHEIRIGETHVASKQGEVTPAWRCPSDGCSFLEWIDLESYGDVLR